MEMHCLIADNYVMADDDQYYRLGLSFVWAPIWTCTFTERLIVVWYFRNRTVPIPLNSSLSALYKEIFGKTNLVFTAFSVSCQK